MKTAVALLIATVSARHHHHHKHRGPVGVRFVEQHEEDMASLEARSDAALVSDLESTLKEALNLEARDDKAAAVAKTAAIKNIQKALTARILKRLDDGQPLVEVARKMKAIEGMQPQINDMERRLGIMQSVEPVLENAIKTLQKVVDVRGMGKKLVQLDSRQDINLIQDDDAGCWSGKGGYLRPGGMSKEEFEAKKKCKDPCESVKRKEKEAEEKAEEADKKAKQMEVIAHKEAATDIIKQQQDAEEKANEAAIEGDKELKKSIRRSQS
jgi:hypothetical protein